MVLEQLSCYAAKQQRLCVSETLAPFPQATLQHREAAEEWIREAGGNTGACWAQ